MDTDKFTASHLRALALLCCLVGLTGCTVMTATTIHSARLSQNEEMDWAPPLRLKIERCYWTQSVNKMDDFANGRAMRGVVGDQMNVTAQDSFLVVELK